MIAPAILNQSSATFEISPYSQLDTTPEWITIYVTTHGDTEKIYCRSKPKDIKETMALFSKGERIYSILIEMLRHNQDTHGVFIEMGQSHFNIILKGKDQVIVNEKSISYDLLNELHEEYLMSQIQITPSYLSLFQDDDNDPTTTSAQPKNKLSTLPIEDNSRNAVKPKLPLGHVIKVVADNFSQIEETSFWLKPLAKFLTYCGYHGICTSSTGLSSALLLAQNVKERCLLQKSSISLGESPVELDQSMTQLIQILTYQPHYNGVLIIEHQPSIWEKIINFFIGGQAKTVFNILKQEGKITLVNFKENRFYQLEAEHDKLAKELTDFIDPFSKKNTRLELHQFDGGDNVYCCLEPFL